MNNQHWPAELSACWLRMDADAVEDGTGMRTDPGAGGLPGNVIALSYARGTGMDPTEPHVVIGTVDLVTAASIFGSGLLRLFDDMTMDSSVDAEFTVHNGNISGWRVSGTDLTDALDREGLLDKVSDELREGMGAFDMAVDYRQVGSTTVNTRAPDPATQMTPAQMDSRQGCAAAH